MAERRMFSQSVVLSDPFLDMSFRARCLYFSLGMVADDDGFVNNYKSIMRQIGVTKKDLNDLIKSQFVYMFNSGVIVIMHWKKQNFIKSDRYKKTSFCKEKDQLIYNSDLSYCIKDGSNLDTDEFQNGSNLDTEYNIDKVKKDKVKEDKVKEDKVNNTIHNSPESAEPPSEPIASLMLNDKTYHHIYQKDVDHYRELYPAVNIEQELRNMIGWIESNPTKRKTRSGIERFITNWLSKNQNQGGQNSNEREEPRNGEFKPSIGNTFDFEPIEGEASFDFE